MMDVLTILEKLLGPTQKTANGEYLFHCVFCHHKKKKLSVNLGRRFGVWKCWVCNRAGKKLVSLLHAVGAPAEYLQVIRELDPEYQGFQEEFEGSVVQIPQLPIDYKPLYMPTKTYVYRHALSYVLSRGFHIQDILKYRVGYCEGGLYEHRLIIPSYDKTNMLNYFVTRAFYANKKPPYKNPAFPKNIIMFENTINWKLPIVLVEGVFDAMTIRQNAIPLLGKFINTALLTKLLETRPPEIYIVLDEDAQESAWDLYLMLNSYGLVVKNISPSKKDANEVGFENIWKQIESSEVIGFKELITHKLYA